MNLYPFFLICVAVPIWCNASDFCPRNWRKAPRTSNDLLHQPHEIKLDMRVNPQNNLSTGLWYLFKRPLLSQILLKYLEPEIFALCVEPETFISESILKQYETELHRYGENSGFFSCENIIFLAITNHEFNTAYRKLHKNLPDYQKKDFEDVMAYIKRVHRQYDILLEVQFSISVHQQLKDLTQFRGISHKNKLFKVIRDHVSLLHSLPVAETNKKHLRQYKWKFLFSITWITLSIIYGDFFFQTPPNPVYMYACAFIILLIVDVICFCYVLPEIFQIFDMKYMIKEIAERNKFINIRDTFQKQKHIKALLFLDEND